MGNNCCGSKKPPYVNINIATLGDSLTDSGYYGKVMDYSSNLINWYQYFMYQQLKTRNIESSILDLGVGGQVISQICNRILSASPSTYITIMAGTNDILSADFSDPNVNENLAAHIISIYKQKIPEVILYQNVTFGYSPIVIICTIPPVGDGPSVLPLGRITEAINFVNCELKKFAENNPDVLLCDTNRSLKGINDRFIRGLCVEDNIHFTETGKLVCGQTIANSIIEHYYKWNEK